MIIIFLKSSEASTPHHKTFIFSNSPESSSEQDVYISQFYVETSTPHEFIFLNTPEARTPHEFIFLITPEVSTPHEFIFWNTPEASTPHEFIFLKTPEASTPHNVSSLVSAAPISWLDI